MGWATVNVPVAGMATSHRQHSGSRNLDACGCHCSESEAAAPATACSAPAARFLMVARIRCIAGAAVGNEMISRVWTLLPECRELGLMDTLPSPGSILTLSRELCVIRRAVSLTLKP